MILTHIDINPELLVKMVESILRLWTEEHPQDTFHPQGNPLLPQVWVGWEMRVVTSGVAWCPVCDKGCKDESHDLWHGIVLSKSEKMS